MIAETVDAILEKIAELSIEDQEMVDEIVRKRVIDGKREGIRADFEAALVEQREGRIKSGTATDLFDALQ